MSQHPGVPMSRGLGVLVSRCSGWCLGVPVSRVVYNVFSNCFLDTCIQATMGQSCSCTVCTNTVLRLSLQCVCTVSSVFTCCQNRFSVSVDVSYLFSTDSVHVKYCITEWTQFKLGHKSNKIGSTLTLLRIYHCTAFSWLSYCCRMFVLHRLCAF